MLVLAPHPTLTTPPAGCPLDPPLAHQPRPRNCRLPQPLASLVQTRPPSPHLTQTGRAPGVCARARPFRPSGSAPHAPALGGSCGGGKAPPPAAPPLSPLNLDLLLGCSRANCSPLGPLRPLPAMVAWRSAFLICLAFSLDTLVQRGKASGVHAGTTPLGPVGRGLDALAAQWCA